ncbi:adenosylcobinamide-phosphate synthase CbiB [Gellertiella hungarica]|uniref:Cobalamin biosynthesis protein CobD n=1 Tax=Gellertiella hungarica TaxID=1572859 RepID=A0A7W6J8X1_9HYPH|nr:adenosylcobinamide-phosphate synthase CbiB [Gellertiella hungarica]MBB4066958.1 adenosylcobinamide-phosphate synthase [Gellertiella hungarica]
MSCRFVVLALALLIDRIFGDPDWLWRKYPHPVVFFGHAISFFDRRWNDPALSFEARRRNGVLALVLLLAGSLLLGHVIHRLLAHFGWPGLLLEAVIASVLLAQKSLADHVMAVRNGLLDDGLAGGRRAVSMIVGRDPETLDEPAVCRAAIESLSENFSDGVVAPAFWFAILGLPGLMAYKMLNTADSMIGHKSDRYLAFGWASARTDDWANLIPARLSVLLIAAAAWVRLGAAAARLSVGTALRDAGLHRSPNSGWPECAMAGALGIQLAGPRIYGGVMVSEPMMNGSGRAAIGAAEIGAAVDLFLTACSVLLALVAAGAVLAAIL